MQDEQLRQDDMFAEQAEEIIDEEELVMLRKMKDLKKIYRDNFAELKNYKTEFAEGQRQIDTIKEQLISAFEEWYAVEFDVPAAGLDNTYNQNLQAEALQATQTNDPIFGGNQEDDDQQTFMRAKKKIEVLHRAKRLERQVGAGRRA